MIIEKRSFIRYLGAAAIIGIADYLVVLSDCIIAGRLLGEMALGAMNLLFPVCSAVTFFIWLLASGTSTIYSAALRRGDDGRAAEIAGQGLFAAGLLGILLVAAAALLDPPYLSFMNPSDALTDFSGSFWHWYSVIVMFKSVEMMMLYLAFVRGGELVCIGSYGTKIILNCGLAYWLCECMGMRGIAIGTAVSYAVGVTILSVWFLLSRKLVPLRLRLDFRVLIQSLKCSFAESFVWLFLALLFFAITKYVLFAWDSESLAVCAVVFCVVRLTVFFGGVGVALRPLAVMFAGQTAPSKDLVRVFRIGAVAAFVVMFVVAAVIFIAPELIIGLFGIESFDLVSGSKLAARLTVGGLVLGGLIAYLPLLWQVRKSTFPEAPLNYLQSYVLSRMETLPDSQMFNLAKLFRLRKGIDLKRLSASLAAAGASHAALSTRIRKSPDGEIVQRWELPPESVKCPIVRMSERDLLADKSSLVKSFNVMGGALFDAKIFDCGETAYLLSNFHHLICDGYSFPLILEDAHRAWNGETLQRDAYYEVLARREERASQPALVAQRNFMRELLKSNRFTTLPPADFAGAPGYGAIEVPLTLAANFEDFLTDHRVTRHHIFLAATLLALRKITDATDLLIDWVFHGRVSKDELKTVGAFMVDLPLIFDGADGLTPADVIALVKRATFNGIKSVNAFRDVSDCNPTGEERLTFIYQDEWGELMSPGPVRADGPYAWMIEETISLQPPCAAPENPFNVEIMEHRESTRLYLEYDTGRYSEATVRRYADFFRESLEELLDA